VHRLPFGVIIVAALLGAVTGGIRCALSSGAGAGFHHVMVSGASTPYEEQFSYQESLVIRASLTRRLRRTRRSSPSVRR
jgi:hypothetical protein